MCAQTANTGHQIVAPSNAAFKNIPYTALNGIWDPTNKTSTVPLLQYHFLQGTVATNALELGPTYVEPTLLINPEYTNVTSGQNVLVAKQPPDLVVFTTSMGTRCTLSQGDIPFQGGLIQIVDNLLIPPAPLGETSEAFQAPSFLGALYAADLMPKVSYLQNVTIFAPQDQAFAEIGGTLQNMTSSDLARIMEYHVIPNQVMDLADLVNGTHIQTLAKDADGNPETILVSQDGNNEFVNSAQIVQPDILIANGILHIIADVLNPDEATVTPNPTAVTQEAVFAASSVSNVFTSDLPCTVSCPITSTTAPANNTATAATPSSDLFTSTSDGAAAPARCTGQVAGVALGVLGVGAGMAWL